MVDRMLEEALIANDSENAKKIADKLISMAKNGSIAAAKLVNERTEGRPKKVDAAQKPEASLTKEQIDARLAELLSLPDIKEKFAKILFSQETTQ
jgi:DNA polymerase elongation subunit (family B)